MEIPHNNKHWSSSGEDAAPVMRRCRFESGPVLLILDNSASNCGAHDVAVACCFAMAEVRVRLPLGALATVPNGRSLQT